MEKEFSHKSVLLKEVVSLLSPSLGETLLDVTVGLGGHAEAILSSIGTNGQFIALDADERNLTVAEKRLSVFPCSQKYMHTNFRELPNLHLDRCDMIVADLGVSSVHLDTPEKGFSFRNDAYLDLRFDQSSGMTATEYIRKSSERELANCFYRNGEISQSRILAAAMKKCSPTTTFAVRACCETVFGRRAGSLLPQVFQSLRIAVNGELEALEVLLESGPELLNPGGRMVVISFHSLEDRLVKRFFKKLCTPIKSATTGQVITESGWLPLTKKPVVPTKDACDANPRSRSAKMRGVQRKSMVV